MCGFKAPERFIISKGFAIGGELFARVEIILLFVNQGFLFIVGLSWKITMLVLSSLALVLGTVILILNVYSNR